LPSSRSITVAADIPLAGIGAKARVDAIGLRIWVEERRPDHAIVELASSMPKQGVASTFRYGRATGSIEAVIACCGIPVTIVAPNTWKRFYGLYGADKETDRQRALQLFPSAHALLALKRHHNRADAALIAVSRSVP
jgi:crossover junction endodeoxyribonuclease RuvC